MPVSKHRGRRKRVGMILVAFLGLMLVAAEAFLISPGVRAVYVGALERAGACDRLAGMLADRDATVRVAALDALVRFGPVAVPAVARHLEDATDPEGRALAAVGLDRIGPPARDALPVLYRRMRDDPDAGVREAVILATAGVGRGDPEAVAALAGLLGDGDEAGRLGAVRALGLMAGPSAGPGPVTALAGALVDPSPRVREQAAESLGSFGPAAAQAIPALVVALRDPDAAVRSEAAEALAAVGAAAREAVPALIGALDDAHPKVRREAAEALNRILVELDGGDALRERATAALARSRPGPDPGAAP